MKNFWMLSGAGAGVFYGIHNLLLGSISEHRGIMTPFYTCFGIMLAYLVRLAYLTWNKKEEKHAPL